MRRGGMTFARVTLELAVPPMDHPGRYWNLMVVDAYTRVSYLRRADYGVGGLSARVTWDPEGGRAKWGTACFAAPPLRRG